MSSESLILTNRLRSIILTWDSSKKTILTKPSGLGNVRERAQRLYELLILSLLMHWPLHAYRLAKIANDIIGPEEHISTGTLSSLLTRLEQAGLIIPADPGIVPFPTNRPSRVFALTSTGRERFFELMMDTTSHQGAYRRLFHIKALHLEFLSPEQQFFLVEHFLNHCRQILHTKRADEQDVDVQPLKREHMSPALREAAFAFMRLKIEQWQLELAWGEALRDQIVSRLKQDKNSNRPKSYGANSDVPISDSNRS